VFKTQLRPVPEPGTSVLLVLGLVCCIAESSRRRKQAESDTSSRRGKN
jgi:PEP-CTERM motif